VKKTHTDLDNTICLSFMNFHIIDCFSEENHAANSMNGKSYIDYGYDLIF